jgi:hypothetical protein
MHHIQVEMPGQESVDHADYQAAGNQVIGDILEHRFLQRFLFSAGMLPNSCE